MRDEISKIVAMRDFSVQRRRWIEQDYQSACLEFRDHLVSDGFHRNIGNSENRGIRSR